MRLLQLASPTLPLGAYVYSQGLKAAVTKGLIKDPAAAAQWIGDALAFSMARMEAFALIRLIEGWQANEFSAIVRWNGLFLVSRETSELRAESAQMGYSLRKLLAELKSTNAEALKFLDGLEEVALPTAFAFAVVRWDIPAAQAVVAYSGHGCKIR